MVVYVVSKLKDAIILSKLKEQPLSKEQIESTVKIGKPLVDRTIREMKRSGLIKGRGQYVITAKGRMHFDIAFRKINGEI